MNKSTVQPARFVARCSESSCIPTYTAVARLFLEARPFGADAPFRSRRNGPARRAPRGWACSLRFFHKL
ncbi:MAG: hypothetical protein ACREYE_33825 [Gammaproteobacteria bacterium]